MWSRSLMFLITHDRRVLPAIWSRSNADRGKPWLSVWGEVQICIWPSWCHWHSLSLASVKSRLVLTPAHPGNPERSPEGHKMCVCACVWRACVLVNTGATGINDVTNGQKQTNVLLCSTFTDNYSTYAVRASALINLSGAYVSQHSFIEILLDKSVPQNRISVDNLCSYLQTWYHSCYPSVEKQIYSIIKIYLKAQQRQYSLLLWDERKLSHQNSVFVDIFQQIALRNHTIPAAAHTHNSLITGEF